MKHFEKVPVKTVETTERGLNYFGGNGAFFGLFVPSFILGFQKTTAVLKHYGAQFRSVSVCSNSLLQSVAIWSWICACKFYGFEACVVVFYYCLAILLPVVNLLSVIVFLAWLPLQSLAVKKITYFCKFWAVKNF